MEIEYLTDAHHSSMVDTLCELFTYYNDQEPDRTLTREHLIGNLLGAKSSLKLLVATSSARNVAGFAAISFVYSLVEPYPTRNHQCMMKELYVRSAYRGQNIGHLLMAAVAREAVSNNCGRIDWPVKSSNLRGISFYEGLGARLVEDRLSYRIDGDHLQNLAMLPAI